MPVLRDVALVVTGLTGICWMTFHGPVNNSLILLFAAMIGVPITLGAKEKAEAE